MFGHRYFGSRYYPPRYFGDGGTVVIEGGYFGHRHFGQRYFGPRYFGPIGQASDEIAGGYFGHNYFAGKFFGSRYYSPVYVAVGGSPSEPGESPGESPSEPGESPGPEEPPIEIVSGISGKRYYVLPSKRLDIEDEELIIFLLSVLNSNVMH